MKTHRIPHHSHHAHPFCTRHIYLSFCVECPGVPPHTLILDLKNVSYKSQGSALPWWHSGWESAYQCRGRWFDPWSGKIPHAEEQLSPCATTTGPVSHNYWSPCAWSPCSATREATAMRSPRTATKSSPSSLQLKKARAQQQRPNAAKSKYINKFILKIVKGHIPSKDFSDSLNHREPLPSPMHWDIKINVYIFFSCSLNLLPKTVSSRYCYCFRFLDKKTKAKKVSLIAKSIAYLFNTYSI